MYQIHILIKNPETGESEYKPVHPTGGKPYEYATRLEAGLMARTCYPDHLHHVKIVPAWEAKGKRGGYFFWKYEDEDGKTVYNVTKEPKPPTTDGGYYSLGYLLKVKGLLKGVTIDSIIKDWSES